MMSEFSTTNPSIGIVSQSDFSLYAWNIDNPFRNECYHCKVVRHVNQENGENKENYPQ